MSEGMIRAVDKMGRVVIPKEYRKQLGIENEVDSFEIKCEGDKLILKKHQPYCVFCNQIGPSVKIAGHDVCINCIDRLNEAREQLK
ncbi:MAG: AbrB/MazE/SpoVT family DNA-binding domain-containing protein [Ruminococcaceae bacterium]|nr:AbrB/MazE/SpoVT family DNA-binding domain-containing protein [Oscillospiraceae bacterium]